MTYWHIDFNYYFINYFQLKIADISNTILVNEHYDPLLSELQELHNNGNGMTDEDDVEEPSITTVFPSNIDDSK